MTHYYYYIKAGLELDSNTCFYQVAIGEGAEGRRLNAWLEAYAVEHGHFFVLQTVDADNFIWKALQSVDKGLIDIIPIRAKDLQKSLKNGCDDPACWQAVNHRHQLLMQINPHYYTYHELRRKKCCSR